MVTYSPFTLAELLLSFSTRMSWSKPLLTGCSKNSIFVTLFKTFDWWPDQWPNNPLEIFVTLKMSRAEYSGRPGNFSGTFFQKGKTGHQSLNFVNFLYCRFEHQYLTDRNHHHWRKALERTKGLFGRPPRTSHRSCLYHIVSLYHMYCRFWVECMIVLSSGDGCRGFEDVIMDEVKDHKNITILMKVFLPLQWIRLLRVLNIDVVNPKVDDLKREFAKKEGEALTLSYKINVRILGDTYLPYQSSLLTSSRFSCPSQN